MFRLNLKDQQKERGTGKNQVYDVIIIGAGPAGLTTAIYTARDGWNTLILEKDAPGGLAASTHAIENYPGFPRGVEGPELMDRFHQQAARFGAEVIDFDEVTDVVKRPDGIFEIATDQDQLFRGRSVLLATGSEPRHLGIPGEEAFANRGVSYCATCDGPLYQGEDVVVVGCGNSGLQEAQVLLEYAGSVTFVEYLDHSIAEQVLKDRVQNHTKARCIYSARAQEIKGNGHVNQIVIEDRQTGEKKTIDASAVFIYIGYTPYTAFVEDLIELDEEGYILTDREMRTSLPGMFAAGDVRSDNLAQIAVAVGDGAKAAVAIREYLQEEVRQPA
mgnify:CR=1 FL=1